MPRLVRKPPAYQLHKATGQARVKIAGHDHWLGPYGSEASHREYERLLAEWRVSAPARAPNLTSAPSAPPLQPADTPSAPTLTVSGLILLYREHVQTYYVKDGQPTSEQDNIRQAVRPVRELYGHVPARDFGPLALKAVRASMIARGYCRSFINQQVARIRGMFRWAVSEELLPPSALEALKSVAGLGKGRSKAREKPSVGPVPDDVIERTLPHMPPVVAAMVRVQRLAGMRPQEVIGLRGDAIDRTDPECWTYRPARHKGQHHERERVIFLGPRARAILGPFLDSAGEGFLFSPRRSEAVRNEAKRAGRVTPRWPSHCKRRRKARPKRSPGECYSRNAYRNAIRRACDRAFPHPELSAIPERDLTGDQQATLESWRKARRWFPHMLRHSAATEVRRQFGVEASQAVLGHSELGTTQLYAEVDLGKAREVARKVG